MLLQDQSSQRVRRTPSPATTNSPQTPVRHQRNAAAAEAAAVDIPSSCLSLTPSETNGKSTSNTSFDVENSHKEISRLPDASDNTSTCLDARAVPSTVPIAAPVNAEKHKNWSSNDKYKESVKKAPSKSNFVAHSAQRTSSLLDMGEKSLSTTAIPHCDRKKYSPCSYETEMTSCSSRNLDHAMIDSLGMDGIEMCHLESTYPQRRSYYSQEDLSAHGNTRDVPKDPGVDSTQCKSQRRTLLSSKCLKGHLTHCGNSSSLTSSGSRSWSNLVSKGNSPFDLTDFESHEPTQSSVENDASSTRFKEINTSCRCSLAESLVNDVQQPSVLYHVENKTRFPHRSALCSINRPDVGKQSEGDPLGITYQAKGIDQQAQECSACNTCKLCETNISSHLNFTPTMPDSSDPMLKDHKLNSTQHSTSPYSPSKHYHKAAPNNSKIIQCYTEQYAIKSVSDTKNNLERSKIQVCLAATAESPRFAIKSSCSRSPCNSSINGRLDSGLSSAMGHHPSRTPRSPSPYDKHVGPGISRAKLKTVKMTVTVVICYVVCWAPFFVGQMWAAFDEKAYQGDFLAIILLLASMNSCTNPWIYTVFSDSLCRRTDQVLRGPCRCLSSCCRRLGCRCTLCRRRNQLERSDTEKRTSLVSSTIGLRSSVKSKKSLAQFGESMKVFVGSKGSYSQRSDFKSSARKNGKYKPPDGCRSRTDDNC
ncbi:vasopressin V2 receptor-like [Elysia marginata]|uniref:Vasopressin V2 receptor-like n=1 Tax=Elysia marginata TaxID=1093978 RepID=A0AAV4IR56_9GAST|nr:vasopressin V2 receptor-like [Elysia marginata]